MALINGCNIPEDLYYFVEKHIWVKEIQGGNVRVGMTAVAVKLSGGKLAGVTVKKKKLGDEFAMGKSIGMVESSKFVGPIPSPLDGVLTAVNEQLESNPNLVVSDPYGEGWIAEMKPLDWENAKTSLAGGPEGIEVYRAKLEADGVSCD